MTKWVSHEWIKEVIPLIGHPFSHGRDQLTPNLVKCLFWVGWLADCSWWSDPVILWSLSMAHSKTSQQSQTDQAYLADQPIDRSFREKERNCRLTRQPSIHLFTYSCSYYIQTRKSSLELSFASRGSNKIYPQSLAEAALWSTYNIPFRNWW